MKYDDAISLRMRLNIELMASRPGKRSISKIAGAGDIGVFNCSLRILFELLFVGVAKDCSAQIAVVKTSLADRKQNAM